MSIFSSRLKELRKGIPATQKQLAALLDITERNYQRYEAGTIDPPTSKTIALADYFNVSLDYLAGRSNNPKMAVQIYMQPVIITEGTSQRYETAEEAEKNKTERTSEKAKPHMTIIPYEKKK